MRADRERERIVVGPQTRGERRPQPTMGCGATLGRGLAVEVGAQELDRDGVGRRRPVQWRMPPSRSAAILAWS